MTVVGAIIISCWVILDLYWIISAFSQKRIAEKSTGWGRIIYPLLMFIALVLLLGYKLYAPLSIVLIGQSVAGDITSSALCIVGLLIAVWARRVLGRNWSAKVVFKKGHELVQSGPYKYVRHPIYSGLILMFLGSALAIGRVGGFIGVVIFILGFWIKLKEEEKLMRVHFGKKYLAYMKEVKALIPYLL